MPSPPPSIIAGTAKAGVGSPDSVGTSNDSNAIRPSRPTATSDAVGAPLPQARLNLSVMEEAIAAGLGDLDESAVAIHLRRTAATGAAG